MTKAPTSNPTKLSRFVDDVNFAILKVYTLSMKHTALLTGLTGIFVLILLIFQNYSAVVEHKLPTYCENGDLVSYASEISQLAWTSEKRSYLTSANDPLIFYDLRMHNFHIQSEGCIHRCRFTTDPVDYPNATLAVFTKEPFREAIDGPENILWGFLNLESVLGDPLISKKLQPRFSMMILPDTKATVIQSYAMFVAYHKPECTISPRVREEMRNKDGRRWLPEEHFQRTKLVAWVVSNHNPLNDREKLAKNLSKLIQVDIYGNRGIPCPAPDCFERLTKQYKFYLAFENSNCDDYITEKLFNNSLSYGMVPIVYGSSIENYNQLAPPNSFIHVNQFPTLDDLAKYLQFLDKNDTAYASYFVWKEYGRIHHAPFKKTVGWQSPGGSIVSEGMRPDCRICGRLHEHLRGERLLQSNIYSTFMDARSKCSNWQKPISKPLDILKTRN